MCVKTGLIKGVLARTSMSPCMGQRKNIHNNKKNYLVFGGPVCKIGRTKGMTI